MHPTYYHNKPLEFARLLWPDVRFYAKQRAIIESVEKDSETYVPAGNMLGKDYVAAYIVLSYFLRYHPVKILTTSATEGHMINLWGEIDRFIRTARFPLRAEQGGPLIVHEQQLRKSLNGEVEKDSYIIARVVSGPNKGEGLSGHHAAYTLFLSDEASGVHHIAYEMAQGWAKRKLIFGNTNPCPPTHFFRAGVERGDVKSGSNGRYDSRVIRVSGDDSPNVIKGKQLEAAGEENPDPVVLPGVLGYQEYKRRRKYWDPMRQCSGLDGVFYQGPELMLFPSEWINRAEQAADNGFEWEGQRICIGSDPAEGGDSTVWAVVCELGLIELLSVKTPDTSVIGSWTKALIRRYRVDPSDVHIDAGGGGKEHADYLRRDGYNINVVPFGKLVGTDGMFAPVGERKEITEQSYTYKNRRAQMYDMLSRRLDPDSKLPFAIHRKYVELRKQLSPIPRLYDGEGRLYLPPKRKVPGSTVQTMIDLCGHSPDEADAVVLGVYGLSRERVELGVL